MTCANTSFPAYIICSRDGPHRRVATLAFTVQVGDRQNHGKLFAVHSFTRAYLENVGTLLIHEWESGMTHLADDKQGSAELAGAQHSKKVTWHLRAVANGLLPP